MGYLAAKHTATLDRPEISFDPTLSNEISQCGRNLLALSTRILDNSILAMRTNKPLYDQGLMAGHDWGFTKTVSPIVPPIPIQPPPVKPANDVLLARPIMPDDPRPTKPRVDEHLDKWFDYYHACKKARINYTLTDLARDKGYSSEYVRTQHGNYKRSHEIT